MVCRRLVLYQTTKINIKGVSSRLATVATIITSGRNAIPFVI